MTCHNRYKKRLNQPFKSHTDVQEMLLPKEAAADACQLLSSDCCAVFSPQNVQPQGQEDFAGNRVSQA